MPISSFSQKTIETISLYKSGNLTCRDKTIENCGWFDTPLNNDQASLFQKIVKLAFSELHQTKATNATEQQSKIEREICFIRGLHSVYQSYDTGWMDYNQVTASIKEILAGIQRKLLKDELYSFEQISAFAVDELGVVELVTAEEATNLTDEQQTEIGKAFVKEAQKQWGTDLEEEVLRRLSFIQTYAEHNHFHVLKQQLDSFLSRHSLIKDYLNSIETAIAQEIPTKISSADSNKLHPKQRLVSLEELEKKLLQQQLDLLALKGKSFADLPKQVQEKLTAAKNPLEAHYRLCESRLVEVRQQYAQISNRLIQEAIQNVVNEVREITSQNPLESSPPDSKRNIDMQRLERMREAQESLRQRITTVQAARIELHEKLPKTTSPELKRATEQLDSHLQLLMQQLATIGREYRNSLNSFIEEGKSVFKALVPQPSTIISPLEAFQAEVKLVKEYQKGTKSYLYVDAKQQLYYFLGLRFDSQSVLNVLTKQAEAFEKLYQDHPTLRPHLLDTEFPALKRGWAAIAEDYKASPEFATKVTALSERLTSKLEENAARATTIAHDPNASVWQLFQENLTNIPVDAAKQLLERAYGPRLTEQTLNFYLEKSLSHLSANQLIGLIAGIAVDVKEEDLIWWQANQPSEEIRKAPFHTVADELLKHFRTDQAGNSILKTFQVPVDMHKMSAENHFFGTHLNGTTLESQNRKNAISILADIDSVALYSTSPSIRISENSALEKLQAFIEKPAKTNLFFRDYYLNILEVSVASIKLLELYRQDPERYRSALETLICTVDKVHLECEALYGQQTFLAYANEWQKLQNHLNAVYKDPTISSEEFCIQAIRHPRQSEHFTIEQSKTLRANMRLSEYLARKVGYWNKYYLESKHYLNPASGTSDLYSQQRVGTLVHLPTPEGKELYRVSGVQMVDGGFVCQVLVPVDTEKYVKANQLIPLKMTFQGTIANLSSGARDFEMADSWVPARGALYGPGYHLWKQQGNKLALPLLEKAIAEIQSKEGQSEAKVHVEITGHSLGAADSQNGAAVVAQAMVENEHLAASIGSIRIVPFNSAGCSDESDQQFTEAMEKLGVNSKLDYICHALVMGDIVQVSGPTKLGKRLRKQYPDQVLIAESKNVYMANHMIWDALDKHCDLVYGDRNRFIPCRILTALEKEESERAIAQFAGAGADIGEFIKHADRLLSKNSVSHAGLQLLKTTAHALVGVLLQPTWRDIPELKAELSKLEKEIQELSSKEDEISKRKLCEAKASQEDFQKKLENLEKLTPDELEKLRKEAKEQKARADVYFDKAGTYVVSIGKNIVHQYWNSGDQMLEGTDLDHIGYVQSAT